MDSPEPQPAPAPGPATRRWITAFAAAFLLFQMLLPLRYYLSGPTTDERFAWRMFSSVKMRDCTAAMFEVVEKDGQRVERQVPEAMLLPWRSAMENHRPDVIQKLMRWWCERPGVLAVRYERTCLTPDSRELPPETRRFERGVGFVQLDGEAAP